MPELNTVAAALAWARAVRGDAGPASLEAQVLLAHHLNLPRAQLLTHPEMALDALAAQVFARDVERLASGEPLAYLTGVQEFYGLTFAVSPQVLIPRPETEQMVDEARAWRAHWGPGHPPRVVDVGSGSGCVGISLAVKAPGLQLAASDISMAALSVARANARRHGVIDRIRFVQGDLLSPFASGLDLICANLPYIPSQDLLRMEVARHEPRMALDGGRDGLDLTRRLLTQAQRRMNPGGCLLLEIEESHGPEARALALGAFARARISLLKDLAGCDRLLRIDL